jgi:hypothetical protein
MPSAKSIQCRRSLVTSDGLGGQVPRAARGGNANRSSAPLRGSNADTETVTIGDSPKYFLQFLAQSRVEIEEACGIQTKDIAFCLLVEKRKIANRLWQIEIKMRPI